MKELLKYASGAAIGIVVTLVILSFIRGCINYNSSLNFPGPKRPWQ